MLGFVGQLGLVWSRVVGLGRENGDGGRWDAVTMGKCISSLPWFYECDLEGGFADFVSWL